ncbi:phytanoyl-CoA dioxygenase [Lacibacter luteus]|uniref:Phytanoyl-CoA dioxygenase n=1 Tax=Lacibacter luteus TaxID=2508719 RepID=A0A4V1M7L4_9BACT|nr:phytanoyl-CoA dioxygenase family protein [Lacibacter luteus]RXK60485.1 phytanoyl-CoA dioxygenase [Lacibacter luteus]
MNLKDKLKDYKLVHWFYNLLHAKQLRHNKQAYEKYNVHKPLFDSISSKDFPDKTSQAWLDVNDSAIVVAQKKQFASFTNEVQEQLLQWSSKGYLHLKNYFTDEQVDEVNLAVDELIHQKHLPVTHDNKVMFGYKHSPAIKNMMQDLGLTQLLSFILDKEVVPFQTLNFIKGSGQRAHSDSIHMTTYPLGYLIAAWVALEDIHADSGPLFYYPGSHKLPYLLNDDFANYSTRFKLGTKHYSDYEDVTEELIEKSGLSYETFLPKKGDIFIWHANLIHGGMPVINPALSRKSMVIHFYAKDVIKYHEITERPSLMEEE